MTGKRKLFSAGKRKEISTEVRKLVSSKQDDLELSGLFQKLLSN